MRRIPEREQVANGDSLGTRLDEVEHRRAHRFLVQRRHLLPLGADAFGNLPAVLPRRQEDRRLRLEDDAVQLPAHLPPDLQHVLEAGGGEQAEPGPFAFEHGIGRHGGAVQEAADLLRRDIPVLHHEPDGLHHRLVGVAARAHDLGGQHRLAGAAAHQVGEGAADVDADVVADPARHFFPSSSVQLQGSRFAGAVLINAPAAVNNSQTSPGRRSPVQAGYGTNASSRELSFSNSASTATAMLSCVNAPSMCCSATAGKPFTSLRVPA